MLGTITLTILITENVLLFGLTLIWLNRHCQKCQKVKCIERIFNKLCEKCEKSNGSGKDRKPKAQYEL